MLTDLRTSLKTALLLAIVAMSLLTVAPSPQAGAAGASNTAVKWTTQTADGAGSWRSVAWSPELGLYAAVASNGTGSRVMTSPDGATWTGNGASMDNA